MARHSFKLLTEKMLDRYLETCPPKKGISSALTPLAQSVTLLQSDSQALPSDPISISQRLKIEHVPAQLLNLIYFLEASGCRISEALSLKANDITYTGAVFVRAKKGSNDRVISGGLATSYLINCKKRKQSPWDGWSRHYVYREFKKLGICVTINGAKNNKITHAFRHQLAKSIKANDMNQDVTKLALGHKNLKSTEYYHESKSKERKDQKRN